ncbi:hypothetical protein RBSWK_06264 [Rhodopirellula baltica SWK14]|uniref:Uncharacterized protein n=1 Tax=Rhodopirellula baltica SWK14 TaxID=993516 RepID=L7C6Z0_RHOBT|nr:hypothetical protein RBSWK_06264 [Rhodopirellula baltica SWK14]
MNDCSITSDIDQHHLSSTSDLSRADSHGVHAERRLRPDLK